MQTGKENRKVRWGTAGAVLGTALAGGAFAAAPADFQPPRPIPLQARDSGQLKVADLQGIIRHLDHSIDILNSEPADRKYRKQALQTITNARDEVQRDLDAIEHRKTGQQDVNRERQRDRTARKEAPKPYAEGLQTVLTYLQHDEEVLSRTNPDNSGHRGKALDLLRKAQKEVQQEQQEYTAARPRR